MHVLAAEQMELSKQFATRSADKFAGLALDYGHGGVPLLADCAARFQCRRYDAVEGGDHRIYIGEVIEFDHSAVEPLLFHAGQYGRKHPGA